MTDTERLAQIRALLHVWGRQPTPDPSWAYPAIVDLLRLISERDEEIHDMRTQLTAAFDELRHDHDG